MWKKSKQIPKQVTLFLSFLFKEPRKSRKCKKKHTAAIQGEKEGLTQPLNAPASRAVLKIGVCQKDRLFLPSSAPTDKNPQRVGPWPLPFKIKQVFLLIFDLQGLALMPKRTW